MRTGDPQSKSVSRSLTRAKEFLAPVLVSLLLMLFALNAVADETAISPRDRQFWSFRPPLGVTPPEVESDERVRTPLDAFVLARLEAAGLSLSPDAPPRTLLRRAYFDLIGLPPSPEEVEAFLQDTRPDAYERLIDQLLDSPHYGERWGRHWLDAAGYTDTASRDTGQEFLTLNEGIWRYRDYVVRSFNQDKPYDRFLTEQLAGDELVPWRNAEEFTPEIREALIATGFLRLATDVTDEDLANVPEKHYEVLDQVVRMISTNLLGLTTGCARCHDHKYDPIPQQDYYRLLAVFASAYNPEEWLQPKNRVLSYVSKTRQVELERHNAQVTVELEKLQAQLTKLHKPYRKRLFEKKLQTIPQSLIGETRSAFETPQEKRDRIQRFLFRKLQETLTITREEIEPQLSESHRLATTKLQAEISAVEGRLRPPGKIQALWDVGSPPTIRVLERGDLQAPGTPVNPGFLVVLSDPGRSRAQRPSETIDSSSGRRLALARWLTSRDHPLTARVLVNRIWQHHFGKGIVAGDNFGRQGTSPTHPELLDWLAVDFMEAGWKIKRLHRLIMTSSVYRQSSIRAEPSSPSAAESVDPQNKLLWRMNLKRIEAEAVRDAVLAVSGKLDRRIGGEPIALEISPDGQQIVAHSDDDVSGAYRRSLYLLARRNYPLTFLEVFDFPIMAVNCTRRTHAATPLQSLQLLNSEFAMQQADFFAARVGQIVKGADTGETISTVYQIALSRQPTVEEVEFCSEHLLEQARLYRDQGVSTAEASQRALASLCQMLICSSEFLYID